MEKIIAEKAAQMVMMDAIAKGHTCKAGLIAYMASTEYKTAVENYIELLKAEFC